MTLNMNFHRLVGAQYATGDKWRNNSRKNEQMEPKQKQYLRDWATNEGAPENQEGPRNEGAVASDSSLGLSCLICKQRLTGPIAKTCCCYGIKLCGPCWPGLSASSGEGSFPFGLLFSRSVVYNSWQPHGLQHTRLPCPSLSPGVCSNSCPLSR